MKSDTIIQLARAKAKRKILENKDSAFRVYKKSVDDQKIDRYLRRHEITDDDLLAMASPVDGKSSSHLPFQLSINVEIVPSPSFSVFTPHNIRSPTPVVSIHPTSTRSPTPAPSLILHALSIKDSQPIDSNDLNDPSDPDDPIVPNDPSEASIIEEDSIDALSMDLEMDIDELFLNKEHSAIRFQRPSMETVANWKLKSEYEHPRGSHRPTDPFMEKIYELLNSMRQGSISTDDSDNSSNCDSLTIEYHRARANPNSIAEQKNPPSTPAEIPQSEIEARARRIATFHGSVLNRYIEKTLHRSRLRNRFEGDILLPTGREIWYCVCRDPDHYQ